MLPYAEPHLGAPLLRNRWAAWSISCGLTLVGMLGILPILAFILRKSDARGMEWVLTLAWCSWVTISVVAVVCGIVGMFKARRPGVWGMWEAVVGLFLGMVGLALAIGSRMILMATL